MKNRREFLSLTANSTLLFKSLVSGLPLSFFMGKSLVAQDAVKRYLIFLNSSKGDPVNCNIAGTYGPGKEDIKHPEGMSPVTVSFGGVDYLAADPWLKLPEGMRDKLAIIHHSSLTSSHNSHFKVMQLMGAGKRNQMLPSICAKGLHKVNQGTMEQPIVLGGDPMSFDGAYLPIIKPRALKDILSPIANNEKAIVDGRDQTVDSIYKIFKDRGTKEQVELLDQFVISRNQARSLSVDISADLDAITGNDQIDQVMAAGLLPALNISPVICLRMIFGGDNHRDNSLGKEVSQHHESIEQLASLYERVTNLANNSGGNIEINIAMLNVFGRTMAEPDYKGREHNGAHNTMLLFGPSVKGGQFGDIAKVGKDWAAVAFDSKTGNAAANGDITPENSLASAGKTVCAALKLEPDFIEDQITSGKVISSAIG